MSIFISICIPAYSRVAYLERLLQSIEIQSFKNYEVVVCDDSSDDSVMGLCAKYGATLPLFYHKNQVALGTPENWNECIRQARGEWIKLMHDDDWFASENALQNFADAARQNDKAFVFSAYSNYYEGSNRKRMVFPEKFRVGLLRKNPTVILAKNIIGPPSVVMHKNDGDFFYDPVLKWLVDVDMYWRRLEHDPLVYINQPLVNVGISSSQVTASVKMAPGVELPEHLHYLKKMGVQRLKSILVYDYWWRFIRNFNITDTSEFTKYSPGEDLPLILKKMTRFQKHLPKRILKTGIFSKMLMLLHYGLNRRYIDRR